MYRHFSCGISRFRKSLLFLGVCFTTAHSASAAAPLPYLQDSYLIVPVLLVLDVPYEVEFQIITTTGETELLLHRHTVLTEADIENAPSWDGELLNIPRLAYNDDFYWGEFSLTFSQPVLFKLERAERNLPGASGVQGKWRILEFINAENCGEETRSLQYDLRVVHATPQGIDDLFVIAPAGEFSATMHDRVLNWSGSYAEDGGTVSTDIEVAFSESLNTLEGQATWTWTNGQQSCNGVSGLVGVLMHN